MGAGRGVSRWCMKMSFFFRSVRDVMDGRGRGGE